MKKCILTYIFNNDLDKIKDIQYIQKTFTSINITTSSTNGKMYWKTLCTIESLGISLSKDLILSILNIGWSEPQGMFDVCRSSDGNDIIIYCTNSGIINRIVIRVLFIKNFYK